MAQSVRTVIFCFIFFSALSSSTLVTHPSDHLITLICARENLGRNVSPICFAAFKLITNSNFVACCTGKSAGFGPFQDLVHVESGRGKRSS